MKTSSVSEKLFTRYSWLVWLLLVAVHCFITFYNGYPVLYSDLGTYLSSGFELQAPADRPITYGLLLTLFSFGGLTLYLVPAIQSLMYLYALKKLCELFFGKALVLKQLCLISLLVLLFTGFGWALNLLLPDFLTPVGFICLYCVLMSGKPLRNEWLLWLLFFVAASSHIANVFSFFVMLVLAAVTQHFFFNKDKKLLRIKLALATVLLAISYLIMGSAISKSRHVFMMGNLAQKGILQKVLQDHCSTEHFELCHYKDSIPRSFEYFVWNHNSPLYKMGGWKSTKAEYKKIIGLSFSKAYLGMHVRESFGNFIAQISTFGIAEGTGAFKDSTVLIKRIRKFIRWDNVRCVHTRQHAAAFIDLPVINRFYQACMALAAVLFITLLFRFRQYQPQIKALIVFTAVLLLSTSMLVAFTGEVSNRYGCRMAWLVLLMDFFMLSAGRVKKQLSA